MRPRDPPSSSSSASSSTSSSASTGKSGITGRSTSFLIPDTFDLINTSTENIAQLECNRRNSSWDEYLYDTAMEKWSCEQDRLEMRQQLLQQMKGYYGNQRWKNVDSLEDIELYSDDQTKKLYLDLLVLYGEHNKRRCRYVDRQDREASKGAFKRRRLNAGAEERESGPRALLRRLGALLSDDFARLTI
ncbi:hypothetical protein NA57DRAFT_78364 [Rhizodiscina lignyota]|uniref:Uncharacterized protein n=1 Tax=Rhizodiscina lignyota TaxID=1504668 RepID=A0A9P4I7S0_9PEZI|nr:hypothetical protein NA57DRAFT_78364 [Rhizodiscina lignyota]